jgi:hypothetical protein
MISIGKLQYEVHKFQMSLIKILRDDAHVVQQAASVL